ncbi:hypothetical protein [Eggerthella lenta]|uniref:hypothetical protein n=1 Tax=Eggerthella lenta TaxID=84112 RepID=UPI0036F209E5
MGDEPIERPEREEARSGEAERAVKEVGSAKSARDADAAGKEGAEPYKPGSFEGGIVEFPSGDEPAVPPRKRLPLVLAIIGLVLCFTGSLALVGAACGAVSLGLFVRDRKATEGSPPRRRRSGWRRARCCWVSRSWRAWPPATMRRCSSPTSRLRSNKRRFWKRPRSTS